MKLNIKLVENWVYKHTNVLTLFAIIFYVRVLDNILQICLNMIKCKNLNVNVKCLNMSNEAL